MEENTPLDYDEDWDYYSDEVHKAYDDGFREGELKGLKQAIKAVIYLAVIFGILSKIETIYLCL